MKYKERHLLKRIPRASYGCFNPYVFTFDLETETICILMNSESDIYLCHGDVMRSQFPERSRVTQRITRNASNTDILFHIVIVNIFVHLKCQRSLSC